MALSRWQKIPILKHLSLIHTCLYTISNLQILLVPAALSAGLPSVEEPIMKKHIALLLSILLLLALLPGCSSKKGLFALDMPGYVAAPVESENTMALTLFLPRRNAAMQKRLTDGSVASLLFPGLEDDIRISHFDIAQNESPTEDSKYLSFGLTITYRCPKAGQYSAKALRLVCSDTTLDIPLSPLYFDIGEQTGTPFVDTWSSPAASSNPAELLCTYTFAPEVEACRIYYAPKKFVELSPAEIESGEVRIPLADTGFTTYVCTRILLQVNGETYTAYGKGCLCGALQAVTDKTLDQLAR